MILHLSLRKGRVPGYAVPCVWTKLPSPDSPGISKHDYVDSISMTDTRRCFNSEQMGLRPALPGCRSAPPPDTGGRLHAGQPNAVSGRCFNHDQPHQRSRTLCSAPRAIYEDLRRRYPRLLRVIRRSWHGPLVIPRTRTDRAEQRRPPVGCLDHVNHAAKESLRENLSCRSW